MAEDSDLERSEPASERRLQQARDRGQVPRSPELSTFSVLLASGGGLMVLGAGLVQSLENILRGALSLDRNAAFETGQMGLRLFDAASQALLGMSPLLLLVIIVALLTPTLVSGWLFTFEGLQPDFSRLSPARGLGRIFSWHGVIELGKAVVKTLLIGGVAVWAIWATRTEVLTLAAEPIELALAHLAMLIGRTFLIIAGAFALIVVIDVPFQIWDFRRQLRMTREEVREEYKETEGNPQIKARIRSMQRETARRRMMQEVPKADVIVTNPAHYAVALRYRDETMRAPRVVAKGIEIIAERITEIAADAGVPRIEAPALARALYAHAEVGRDIPAALFGAVAEVLAWVYNLRRAQESGAEAPRPPSELDVPRGMDPGPGVAS
jgi:flagellar biosynthesis protein FlhB